MSYQTAPIMYVAIETIRGSGNTMTGKAQAWTSMPTLPLAATTGTHQGWTILVLAYSAANDSVTVNMAKDYAVDEEGNLTALGGWLFEVPPPVQVSQEQPRSVQGKILQITGDAAADIAFEASGSAITEPSGTQPGTITGFGTLELASSGDSWSAFAFALEYQKGWMFYPLLQVEMEGTEWDPTKPVQGVDIDAQINPL